MGEPVTWNYRVVKHEGWYAVHEVYYEGETPVGMTTDPVVFTSEDGAEEIAKALELALKDVRDRPVFVPPKEWG